MAEPQPPSPLRKLDAVLRVVVALLGTIPMTVLALSLGLRLLCSPAMAEALAAVLFLPCWIAAISVAWVVSRGVKLATWVLAISAASWALLGLIG